MLDRYMILRNCRHMFICSIMSGLLSVDIIISMMVWSFFLCGENVKVFGMNICISYSAISFTHWRIQTLFLCEIALKFLNIFPEVPI